MRIPGGREENLRLVNGHGDVGDADVGAFVENAGPVRAAIGGFVHAALIARTVGVAQHAHVDGLRVRGIDENAADVPRIVEADVRPGLARVVGAVHAVAGGQVGADVRLARADVDHAGIGRRHGDGPNGRYRLMIEDRIPHGAGVGGLPHPAVDAAEVEGVAAALLAADGHYAAGAERAYQSPSQPAVKLRRNLGHRGGRAQRRQKEEQHETQTAQRGHADGFHRCSRL